MTTPSCVIFICGCVTTLNIHESLTIANLPIPGLSGDPNGGFNMELIRLFSVPSVFIENPKKARPEWCKYCHNMINFDIRNFEDANWKDFEHLFAHYREQFGPMVPQCWLSDILGGRGRFYGLWKSQILPTGKRFGHLTLLDDLQDSSPPVIGTPSAADSPRDPD